MTLMSDRLKEFAHRLARQYGIRELKPGESRPVNYYVGNRATGQPLVASEDAVIRAEPDRATPEGASTEAGTRRDS